MIFKIKNTLRFKILFSARNNGTELQLKKVFQVQRNRKKTMKICLQLPNHLIIVNIYVTRIIYIKFALKF